MRSLAALAVCCCRRTAINGRCFGKRCSPGGRLAPVQPKAQRGLRPGLGHGLRRDRRHVLGRAFQLSPVPTTV